MSFIPWLLGAGVIGGGALLYKKNQSGNASAAASHAAVASGQVSVPLPSTITTPSAPATPSSAPAVPSSTNNPVADIVNFISSADDILTGATQTGDFPVEAVVSTHDTGSAGDLNVRATPSTGGAVTGKLAHGSLVHITGPAVPGDGSQPGGWAPVLQGGTSGFASMAFLNTDPSAVAAAGGS